MAVGWRDQRLHRIVFGHTSRRSAVAALGYDATCGERLTAPMRDLVRRLAAMAEGKPTDFSDVQLDVRGLTPFARTVLHACRRIPRGEVLTYGQLAARVGNPRGARAVGNVMARNRVPLVVPCHRVVGAHGRLGGYSAPDGLGMKQRLLHVEGAPIAPRSAR
jgi:methylated-DNA-[protein]-cysteine S-methyltransferase